MYNEKRLVGLLTTFPVISSRVVARKLLGLSMHWACNIRGNRGTMSKNRLVEIPPDTKPIWRIHSPTLIFS